MAFEIFTTDPLLNSRGRATASKKMEIVGALAEELVSVRICGRSKRKKIGVVEEVLTPSSHRIVPRCSHAPRCGGCSLQQMRYEAQTNLKQEKIHKLFAPFNPTFHPLIVCDNPWEYRNKMEFSFSQDAQGNRYLGLVLGGSKGKVINLQECHLGHPWMIQLLKSIRLFWEESGLHAYRMDNTGSMRTLTLREGIRTQDKMVILTVSGRSEYALSKQQLEAFQEAVHRVVPNASIFLVIQQTQKGIPTQFFEMHLSGKDHILEKMVVGGKEYVFTISPSSFFQPNTVQAEKLYQRALDLLDPGEVAFDLFSGTSTFSLVLAQKFKEVIAIEINPYAVMDAKVNIARNAVSNVEILQGDVAEKLQGVDKKADLIVIDPPRAGCGPKGLELILSQKPKKILYISCNPDTQAPEVAWLVQKGYQLLAVQPVDQFPHTVHCENICVLHFS